MPKLYESQKVLDMDKTLVVMAAGLGSRYGGGKQVEKVGPGGEILMEYAIYDAIQAGFDHVVVIVKPGMADEMRALFGDRVERASGVKIEYAYQEASRFTQGYIIPAERTKPLGTVHCVICAKDVIKTPFAVINADDYYGGEAFRVIASELDKLDGPERATMVAYELQNTVSLFGTVTRGVCRIEDGLLQKVVETYKIGVQPDGSIADLSGEQPVMLDPEMPVSMNLWGYHPAMLDLMEQYFSDFLAGLSPDELKAECLLPIMMDDLTAAGKCATSVLHTPDKWFGLTYPQDKQGVCAGLQALHDSGVYPATLWNTEKE